MLFKDFFRWWCSWAGLERVNASTLQSESFMLLIKKGNEQAMAAGRRELTKIKKIQPHNTQKRNSKHMVAKRLQRAFLHVNSTQLPSYIHTHSLLRLFCLILVPYLAHQNKPPKSTLTPKCHPTPQAMANKNLGLKTVQINRCVLNTVQAAMTATKDPDTKIVSREIC